jgi:putative nucleotidyltransferase with HDIG domain
VLEIALALAQEMGLSKRDIAAIRVAASIHDIGKISIPGEILSKPGRLSNLEMLFMREHPDRGAEMLKDIAFPWPVAEIIRQHHERWDGSGYPQGLAGEDILLASRVIGVADTVDAMASHRPYRPAHGIDLALAEISSNRGILYDPRVVDACLRLFQRGDFSLEPVRAGEL